MKKYILIFIFIIAITATNLMPEPTNDPTPPIGPLTTAIN
jgi:hypothetical protein